MSMTLIGVKSSLRKEKGNTTYRIIYQSLQFHKVMG
jgi:hypothetical protein